MCAGAVRDGMDSTIQIKTKVNLSSDYISQADKHPEQNQTPVTTKSSDKPEGGKGLELQFNAKEMAAESMAVPAACASPSRSAR
jgi:hypothetical protein